METWLLSECLVATTVGPWAAEAHSASQACSRAAQHPVAEDCSSGGLELICSNPEDDRVYSDLGMQVTHGCVTSEDANVP